MPQTDTTTPDQILDAVCVAFGVERDAILGEARDAKTAEARQVACYLLSHAPMATGAVGRCVNRDRTTAVHAIRRTRSRMTDAPAYRLMIEGLATTLGLHLGPRCEACGQPLEEQKAA